MGKNKGCSSKIEEGQQSQKLKGATAVKVRHILCEKHNKIQEALARLQAGDRFDQVAREISEDKARQGGDLGWKTRQEIVSAFADAAFALQVGETTKQPVKTEYGYHLILCEGHIKVTYKCTGHLKFAVLSAVMMKPLQP
ncbi:hypothetical protein WJX84_006228 [Apatococcus fuscideae]|uniref:Peptidyl-prolyl cis-trans isomerase n=1 Tax=Apatococcus fuscideae TaxID=2026836 RepID=A0AAW1ST83_9CHLO